MARACATIDPIALAHNLARVRELAPQSQIFAAVKADGYGHGATTVAHALDADGLVVSSLDEALRLRFAGIQVPIATLSQPLDNSVLGEAAAHGIQPVVYDTVQVEAVEQYVGPAVDIWLKIDSGMHRLGVAPEQVSALADRLLQVSAVASVSYITHLACADDPASAMTEQQIACFQSAVGQCSGAQSIANSAAVLTRPQAHADCVRPGIMLYGSSPLIDQSAEALDLRAVMELTAPVISRHRVAAGESIGYGACFTADRDLEIAVVGIGYGDGYPRHAPTGTPVVVGGRRCRLVGRVSMDMITVDVSDTPEVVVGDRATLWGSALAADEVAEAAGTIAYELFCRLTPRVVFQTVSPTTGQST